MIEYCLYLDGAVIRFSNGSLLTIYFNENSGKVYFRYKTRTITQIKHPGIFLGVDNYGTGYFLHNHYQFGKAHIVTEHEFSKGMPLYVYAEKCSNAPLNIIKRGLDEVLRAEIYKPLSYNCQTFINTVCYNQRRSEDVESWINRVLVGSLAVYVLNNSSGR